MQAMTPEWSVEKSVEEIATKLAGELLAVFNGSADHGQINVATFLIREALTAERNKRLGAEATLSKAMKVVEAARKEFEATDSAVLGEALHSFDEVDLGDSTLRDSKI